MSAVLVCLSDYPRDLVEGWVADGDVEVVLARRGAPMAEVLPDLERADVVIGDAARTFPLDGAVLARMRRCRLLVHPAVGLDGVVDLDAARAHGITVVNAPGYNAEAVADWTLMAMLLMLRDGTAADRDLREHGWHARPLGRELGAMTVGIVGYGAIGRAVHRRLRGFGATVLLTDSRPVPPGDALDGRQVELDDLLGGSDVVTLHAPLTDTTRHLLDARRLARMRDGSVLVNAARGELVDEVALAAAIEAGRPAAAALDVFATEPLPPSSPLLALENVYASPHIAAGTVQARQRVRALVGDAVRGALLDLTTTDAG
ncbi:D-isomer specific 2-hydroxyacid dehydrogenase NAD-binding [Beutenbergia cavernae DSM 12333]|uniref:D-isomer specific 2-hydroxyacid dehydrogenase NAD-binding n=1 Tax=Beutenbergia cavernae (strain ATCC BAA-8 / DSM 12333 / CCUG 43141 / JCM 11478 / NBRC 16432 / NCIMB 13614 / HKI 0122) TaxID=471853 RepID=C5C429_BEUC1|nr:2-hydroxyacid dehydrogenase [Beutenbergia cavernae]ACQ79942.1 D-isomer specific 2-hydroxyacid dehydrogenase NAD-binding [Beutenbergia cavernae DSM 12333]